MLEVFDVIIFDLCNRRFCPFMCVNEIILYFSEFNSKFKLHRLQDSPVFNYINSLSPIKPVKSVHITQTFSSLSFSSPPSVFTSPHVSCHKESRFLRRYL